MKPVVSEANINDLEGVACLFDQYRIFYSMTSDLAKCKKFITKRLSNNDSIIYIARVENKAAGFAQIYPSFSSVAMQPIWVLNDLFVGEQYRKLGCAKSLMNKVETEALKQRMFSVKLSTAIDNHAAKQLYHSVGYTRITQFDNYSLTPAR
ncbi:MAG: GNAT family N-acetyltransferase [Kangiellaceae bacterium]|nr:GNAT family N-acetyltransferase [Kangiellaceae bacterium]